MRRSRTRCASIITVLTHSKWLAHGLSAALHSAASPRPHTPYGQQPHPSGARPSGHASWSRGHRTAAHPPSGHWESLRFTAAAAPPPPPPVPMSPDTVAAITTETMTAATATARQRLGVVRRCARSDHSVMLRSRPLPSMMPSRLRATGRRTSFGTLARASSLRPTPNARRRTRS